MSRKSVAADGRSQRLPLCVCAHATQRQIFAVFDGQGGGHYHRDIKPDNVVISPMTGQTSVIDYGLKVWSDMENYHAGESEGYWPPEVLVPGANGKFEVFCNSKKRAQALNQTTDVFMASHMALQAAMGLHDLPWPLRVQDHDLSSIAGYVALMRAHAKAAAAGYDQLIDRVLCPMARDYFEQTMCSDPAQRLTPAKALQHPWLVGCAAAVQLAVATATPACQQVNQQIVDLFSGVPGIILPQHQQQQQEEEEEQSTATCSVSSTDVVDAPCCSTASACSICSESFSTRSTCSSGGDAAAADQHPADTAAATPKKPGLIKRGKRVLSKLTSSISRRASKLATRAGSQGFGITVSTGGMTETTAAVAAQADKWVDDDEPQAVPGLCGLRWLGCKKKDSLKRLLSL